VSQDGEAKMCLSTVYLNSVEENAALMKDVARIEADGRGFWLIDLFRERRFVEGRIQTINLMDGQCVMVSEEESAASPW
jgi:predicted RNA-binding protein